MLGKTNITTVKGGITVSDVKDFVWNEVSTLSVDSAFKRVFFSNNTLVAITGGGNVIYSKDGENWEEAVFEMSAEVKIVDGFWDGKQFVFAANNRATINPSIITTEDFQEYKRYSINSSSDIKQIYAIFCNTDGSYTIICAGATGSSGFDPYKYDFSIYFYKGTPENMNRVGKGIDTFSGRSFEESDMLRQNLYIKTARTSNTLVFYIKGQNRNGSYSHKLGITEDGTSHEIFSFDDGSSSNKYEIFSFKNALYYRKFSSEAKYLIRIKNFSDQSGDIVSSGKDWEFIGGEYFNKCDILVNANQMLIIRPGEHIADKTIEDLIDITYDFSITNIIKAFGKLYIFGTDSHILVSSDEIRDENALAVKTMSARRALYEAQKYTDKKYEELEERVARLEDLNNSSSTEV